MDRLRSATLSLDELNEGFDRMAAGVSVRDVVDPWQRNDPPQASGFSD